MPIRSSLSSHASNPQITQAGAASQSQEIAVKASRAPTEAGLAKHEEHMAAVLQMATTALDNETKIAELQQKRITKQLRIAQLEIPEFHNNADLGTIEGRHTEASRQLKSVQAEKSSKAADMTDVQKEIQKINADRKRLEDIESKNANTFGDVYKKFRATQAGIDSQKQVVAVGQGKIEELESDQSATQKKLQQINKKLVNAKENIEKLVRQEIEALHADGISRGADLMNELGQMHGVDTKFLQAAKKLGNNLTSDSLAIVSQKKQSRQKKNVISSDEVLNELNKHLIAITKRSLTHQDFMDVVDETQKRHEKKFVMLSILLVGAIAMAGKIPVGALVNQLANPSGEDNLLKRSGEVVDSLHSGIRSLILFTLVVMALKMHEKMLVPAKDAKASLTLKNNLSDQELYKVVFSLASVASRDMADVALKVVERNLESVFDEQRSTNEFKVEGTHREQIEAAIEEFAKKIDAEAETRIAKHPDRLGFFENLRDLVRPNQQKIVDGAASMITDICSKAMAALAGDDSELANKLKGPNKTIGEQNNRIVEVGSAQDRLAKDIDLEKAELSKNQSEVTVLGAEGREYLGRMQNLMLTEAGLEKAKTAVEKSRISDLVDEMDLKNAALSESQSGTVVPGDADQEPVGKMESPMPTGEGLETVKTGLEKDRISDLVEEVILEKAKRIDNPSGTTVLSAAGQEYFDRMKSLMLTEEGLERLGAVLEKDPVSVPSFVALGIEPAKPHQYQAREKGETSRKKLETMKLEEDARYGKLVDKHATMKTVHADLSEREKRLTANLNKLTSELENKRHQDEQAGVAVQQQIADLNSSIKDINQEISERIAQEKKVSQSLKTNTDLLQLMTPNAIRLVMERHLLTPESVKAEMEPEARKNLEAKEQAQIQAHAEKNEYASYFAGSGSLLFAVHKAHENFEKLEESHHTKRLFADCGTEIAAGIKRSAPEQHMPTQGVVYDMSNGKVSHLYAHVIGQTLG